MAEARRPGPNITLFSLLLRLVVIVAVWVGAGLTWPRYTWTAIIVTAVLIPGMVMRLVLLRRR